MTTMSPGIPDGFVYQVCGLCDGAGKGALGPEVPCPPCDATGMVLVHKPPLKCVRCNGSGRARAGEISFNYSVLCAVCRGAGWVMVLVQ